MINIMLLVPYFSHLFPTALGHPELDGQVICEAAGRRLPGSASRDSLYNTCHHSYVDEDSKVCFRYITCQVHITSVCCVCQAENIEAIKVCSAYLV